MYFYIIQLFDFKYKDDIILALTSVGIEKGTHLEGENYDYLLKKDFPLFTGFFKTKEDKERISSLFFGMVDAKESIEEIPKLLDKAGIKNKDKENYEIILLKGDFI